MKVEKLHFKNILLNDKKDMQMNSVSFDSNSIQIYFEIW